MQIALRGLTWTGHLIIKHIFDYAKVASGSYWIEWHVKKYNLCCKTCFGNWRCSHISFLKDFHRDSPGLHRVSPGLHTVFHRDSPGLHRFSLYFTDFHCIPPNHASHSAKFVCFSCGRPNYASQSARWPPCSFVVTETHRGLHRFSLYFTDFHCIPPNYASHSAKFVCFSCGPLNYASHSAKWPPCSFVVCALCFCG